MNKMPEEFIYTRNISIGGRNCALSLDAAATTRAWWLQGIIYRKLAAQLEAHPDYACFVEDRVTNGQVYSYAVLVAAIIGHDLPFDLPSRAASGAELLEGFEQVMALPMKESADLLAVVEPMIAAQIDPVSAPGYKLSEEQKKSTR